MATKRKPLRRRPPTIPTPPDIDSPAMRAWRVLSIASGDVTVTAHYLDTYDGCAVFTTRMGRDDDAIATRLFAAGSWREIELVDVQPEGVHGGTSDE